MSRSSTGAFGWESLEEALRTELAPELELVRRIGGGGATAVFLAREPALQRLVAVKLLRPGRSAGKARERFMREVRAIARISHPNVLSLYRIGTILDDVPYVVMQFVRGGNLAEKLSAAGRLTLNEGRRIIGSVASALEAAHARRILHRDLNPTNVLCEEDTGQVFLADFGLALLLEGDEGSAARLTTEGHVIGNLRYLSPEQLEGLDPGEPSDIWGLGVLAWETLTGRGPFDGESLSATLEASRTGAISSLGEEVEGLSPGEVEILNRCLARRPEDRPSARAVVRSLQTTFDPVARSGGPRAGSEPSAPAPAPTTEARILLRAFRSLELECRNGSDVEAMLRQPKRMALLLLLSHGGAGTRIRRDSLVGLLWPDSDQAHGRHALRQSLYFIRRALGADLFQEGSGSEVGVRGEVLACDVAEFRRHARAGRPDVAMSWYRGDLLPGFFLGDAVEFERWLESERIALRRMASSCCWDLSDRYASAGDAAEAGAWARRAAEYTPFDEAALQRLIRLLDRLGDRAGALRAFDHFARRMAEEYAVQPSPETTALVASVCARG